MAKPVLIARPIYAFAVAVIASGAYFAVMFGLLTRLNVTLSLPLYLFLMAIPVLSCGTFQYVFTRNSTLSQPRRWLQTSGAALGAPALAWYLIGFAFIMATGEAF